MKTNVVYFSRTGNNGRLARAIARALEDKGHAAELNQLKTTHPNASVIPTVLMSVFKMPARLVDPPVIKDGDLLVLVGPVWASAMCPAIRAFLGTLPDLGGRKVLNIVAGFNPHENVVRDINHKIKTHNSGLIVSDALRLRDVDNPEKMSEYAEGMVKRILA
ncbi:MAG: flavodoxin family protein [Spirochaetaceae bacterium]|nr:MAG: flavodoxin family protein [Spirochaetaceae bacterium]